MDREVATHQQPRQCPCPCSALLGRQQSIGRPAGCMWLTCPQSMPLHIVLALNCGGDGCLRAMPVTSSSCADIAQQDKGWKNYSATHLWIQQQRGHVMEQDALLWKIWNLPNRVRYAFPPLF